MRMISLHYHFLLFLMGKNKYYKIFNRAERLNKRNDRKDLSNIGKFS